MGFVTIVFVFVNIDEQHCLPELEIYVRRLAGPQVIPTCKNAIPTLLVCRLPRVCLKCAKCVFSGD